MLELLAACHVRTVSNDKIACAAGLNNQRKKANIEFEKKDDDSLNGLFVCTCLPY